MRILGCDPGFTGALALRDTTYRTLTTKDAPVLSSRMSSGKTRDELDLAELTYLVRELKPDHAFVERVSAMPGQGVTSMFRFGLAYGNLLGILAACQVPVTKVAPQEWRRVARVPPGKDGSRQRAKELYPANACDFRRVKDHGRSDAALMAFFGELALDTPF